MSSTDSDDEVICLGVRALPTAGNGESGINESGSSSRVHYGSTTQAIKRKRHLEHHVASTPTQSGNRARLLGRAFAQDGADERYRGVQLHHLAIQIDDVVVCEDRLEDRRKVKREGLVRYIVARKPTGSRLSVLCHVQWLCEAQVGEEGEYFLKHGTCCDIDVRLVKSVKGIRVGNRSAGGAFVKHVYQSSYNVWRDIKRTDGQGHPACDACLTRTTTSKPSVELPTVHLDDCVLIDEKTISAIKTTVPVGHEDGALWRVARVVAVYESLCRVQLLDRHLQSTASRGLNIHTSEKRLVLTEVECVINIHDILDLAYVADTLEGTAELPSGRSFYCNTRVDAAGSIIPLSRPIKVCHKCHQRAREAEASYQAFRRSTRLPATDYYSGGGGGIIGGADFFNHCFAVEREVHACRTLMRNFPRMTVICQSVGAASSDATYAQGRAIRYPGQATGVPSLPKRGSTALALAGPPCQGHTGANHHNKLEDPRNDELFVAISEVDRLRPDIFILENVPGMKMEKNEVNGEDTRNFALGAIKALRRIGYQCRLTLLDARSFGSPQNRVRLFLICAREGVPLPSNPEPTHANPVLSVNSFAAGLDGQRRVFYVGSKGTQGSAPYPAVTVRDALSDMPCFEYDVGQAGLMPRFKADGQNGDRVGSTQPVPYARPVVNDYQARLREGNERLVDHYTPSRSARVLDIIAKASVMVGEKTHSDIPGKDRRINPDRGATTLLTDSAPGGMYTGAVHWNQRRTLTVAERKRLQGVPDRYELKGTVQEQDRMLGNMINVDMSRALHGHIHREVFFPVWLEMGKPHGEEFFRRWRERYPV